MSLITVVRDVCAVVGVAAPVSVIAAISSNRTMFEMLACANEMAQRIAYDTRDWTEMRASTAIVGNGVLDRFPLPANYKRMLLTTNIRRRSTPTQPLRFISDHDQWMERALNGDVDSRGEWILSGGDIWVSPVLPAGDEIIFTYLDKNCINLASGGQGDRFQADTDTFRLDERLLKLGMTFDWKMKKGSPYAEDMGTYSDAIAMAMGHDKPSPIIVGRFPIQGRVAYHGMVPYP